MIGFFLDHNIKWNKNLGNTDLKKIVLKKKSP